MHKQSAHPEAGSAEIALSALLGRSAAELAALTHLAADLQHRLGPSLLPAGIPPDLARALQSLDRMTQVMDDLSQLMAVASQIGPQDASLPAPPLLQAMRLVELRERLLPPHPAKPSATLVTLLSEPGDDGVFWL
jgi:hypothetical protein